MMFGYAIDPAHIQMERRYRVLEPKHLIQVCSKHKEVHCVQSSANLWCDCNIAVEVDYKTVLQSAQTTRVRE